MIESATTGITEWDVIVRLVVITILSGIIGTEREYYHKPAGLRTNVMVGLGSTVFTLASIRAVDLFPGTVTDPTRIAAQIVTGIGFLGVGTIIFERDRTSVVGLTTAATLWVVAGLGIAVGMGLYIEAIVSTALVFFTFFVLSNVVDYVRKKRPDIANEDAEYEFQKKQ
jgi:putative Mg2+ transporter-C (MgtC) family protein